MIDPMPGRSASWQQVRYGFHPFGRRARRWRLRLLLSVVLFGLLFGLLLGGRDTGSLPVTAIHTSHPGVGSSDSLQAVYVVRHGLRSAESIDDIVRQAVASGANALFVQVNGRSEAYYFSDLLVTAQGVQKDFDPLAYLLQRAREAGLSVHAWVNAYTAGMLLDTPAHPDHVLNRHPEWVTVDNTGRSLWDYDWREAQVHVPARMLDPGVPAVADFVFDSVMEVVYKYDVDGIHIDYIRYPSRRFGYHPQSLQRFKQTYGFDPLVLEKDAHKFVETYGRSEFERLGALWDEWRREQVTSLVRRLQRAIKEVKPEVVFSVAVIADAAVAVKERLQDWPDWLAAGLVDALVVMAYSPDERLVVQQVETAQTYAQPSQVPVYAGIGAYMLTDNPAAVGQQVEMTLATGAAGTVIFSHDTILDEPAVVGVLSDLWDRR